MRLFKVLSAAFAGAALASAAFAADYGIYGVDTIDGVRVYTAQPTSSTGPSGLVSVSTLVGKPVTVALDTQVDSLTVDLFYWLGSNLMAKTRHTVTSATALGNPVVVQPSVTLPFNYLQVSFTTPSTLSNTAAGVKVAFPVK